MPKRTAPASERSLLAAFVRAVKQEIAAVATGEREHLAGIGELAGIMGVDPRHLSRAVKQTSGSSRRTRGQRADARRGAWW